MMQSIKDEAKEKNMEEDGGMIEDAGTRLTDEELASVAGGVHPPKMEWAGHDPNELDYESHTPPITGIGF